MPRTNLCRRDPPHAQLGRLLAGAAEVQNADADRLGRAMGKCGKTARDRIRHPGDLTVSELVAVAKDLRIPIDELRAAIRY